MTITSQKVRENLFWCVTVSNWISVLDIDPNLEYLDVLEEETKRWIPYEKKSFCHLSQHYHQILEIKRCTLDAVTEELFIIIQQSSLKDNLWKYRSENIWLTLDCQLLPFVLVSLGSLAVSQALGFYLLGMEQILQLSLMMTHTAKEWI